MSDVIHLLPDSIANQIAAGEVIQRPSSVVKELVENAIDAGAKNIIVNIKDAGRTLIEVIDNGKGMSETDARLAFERHATSKIQQATDLFALSTMGFRGEALASIAAVAHVELKTKEHQATTGTKISIQASTLQSQEDVACPEGSIFSVKNLFFNVPARRKFLKSNDTEFRHILQELERIALVNHHIGFQLFHNENEALHLPESSVRQRIANLVGKSLNQQLLPLNVQTSLVSLSGFIGSPTSSRKRGALQYLFVNGRYMRHPYFHKAICNAFEAFIPAGESPNYIVYFEVDPASIDVNIHPTKTEIKFEHEQALFPILLAAVKESIGKSAVTPSIEFDQEGAIDIPVYSANNKNTPTAPKIQYQEGYNPFSTQQNYPKPSVQRDWELLFEKHSESDRLPVKPIGLEEELNKQEAPSTLFSDTTSKHCYLYKGRYIITSLRSGLAIINQRRAHVRVLYQTFLQQLQNKKGLSQRVLFPEVISFTSQEALYLPCLLEEFTHIGYELTHLGSNSYSISAVPNGTEKLNPVHSLKEMVHKVAETGCEIREEVCEALALSLAKQAAIPYEQSLSEEEATHLLSQLFASPAPNYTPDGKIIITLLSDTELEKRFK